MNPYQHRVTCSICGGGGVATGHDAASEWYGGKLAHSNPEVCRQNLERKRIAEEQAKEDKAAQERATFDADDEYMFEQMETANEND